MSKKPLIIANWKMNPSSSREACFLAQKIDRGIRRVKNVEVVIAPPFPFLAAIRPLLRKAKLGAQNMFWEDLGPYTGEVSWRQLKSLGITYIIIGHSERRMHLGETEEKVNKKVRSALLHGLSPILCVGERERTDNDIPPVVGEQLKSALKNVRRDLLKKLAVAYEPVWAISTQAHSQPDTPENAFRAMLYLRRIVAALYDRKSADVIRVIYGGSVSAKNARSFLREGRMDGALVGGASLYADEFTRIVKSTSTSTSDEIEDRQ